MDIFVISILMMAFIIRAESNSNSELVAAILFALSLALRLAKTTGEILKLHKR
jgi:hypothetical protein